MNLGNNSKMGYDNIFRTSILIQVCPIFYISIIIKITKLIYYYWNIDESTFYLRFLSRTWQSAKSKERGYDVFVKPKVFRLGGQPRPKCVDLVVSQVHVTWVWHFCQTQDTWTWQMAKFKERGLGGQSSSK